MEWIRNTWLPITLIAFCGCRANTAGSLAFQPPPFLSPKNAEAKPQLAASPSGPLWRLERSLAFQPYPFPPNVDAGKLGFEDAYFQAEDGTKLHGWFAEAKDARAVVLYHHGNAGNVTHRGYVLNLFCDRLKTSILVYDYRGFGKSEGTPSEKGILMDARAARAWLTKRTNKADYDIVHVGNSLGGAVAVDIATERARGLVLENTFSSFPEVAQAHMGLLPVSSMVSMQLPSEQKIRDYKGVLLQTHGDADQVVPFALGKKLFAAAPDPKQFVQIPGGGHNDYPKEVYIRALDEWIERLPLENLEDWKMKPNFRREPKSK